MSEQRDTNIEDVLEILLDHANAEEANAVELKHRITRLLNVKEAVAVKEEPFSKLLGWGKTQGSKLGEFEVTTRKANSNSDVFNHVYNILKRNNAAINARLHGEGYKFSYWLYHEKPDVIYRQLLKTK